ncbi:MAG: hypothetical protein HZA88_02440 [Verrucomicrobia bacterium]|nr:hypothetical protein [Verrucomicrobiota bacterium]
MQLLNKGHDRFLGAVTEHSHGYFNRRLLLVAHAFCPVPLVSIRVVWCEKRWPVIGLNGKTNVHGLK